MASLQAAHRLRGRRLLPPIGPDRAGQGMVRCGFIGFKICSMWSEAYSGPGNHVPTVFPLIFL